jgi:bifunctional DNase/RNase
MITATVARLGLDRSTNSPVVILQEAGGDRVLPIWIGVPEASAIALELQHARPPRPMTHDLLKTLLVGLGGELRHAAITRVEQNTFYAELLVVRGDQLFTIDARPSDAIALALRAKAPILVADALFAGDAATAGDAAPPSADELKRRLEGLDPEDFGRFQP